MFPLINALTCQPANLPVADCIFIPITAGASIVDTDLIALIEVVDVAGIDDGGLMIFI